MSEFPETLILTRVDLVKWAQKIPVSEIDLRHIRDIGRFNSAHRVVFHENGRARVLKDRTPGSVY